MSGLVGFVAPHILGFQHEVQEHDGYPWHLNFPRKPRVNLPLNSGWRPSVAEILKNFDETPGIQTHRAQVQIQFSGRHGHPSWLLVLCYSLTLRLSQETVSLFRNRICEFVSFYGCKPVLYPVRRSHNNTACLLSYCETVSFYVTFVGLLLVRPSHVERQQYCRKMRPSHFVKPASLPFNETVSRVRS